MKSVDRPGVMFSFSPRMCVSSSFFSSASVTLAEPSFSTSNSVTPASTVAGSGAQPSSERTTATFVVAPPSPAWSCRFPRPASSCSRRPLGVHSRQGRRQRRCRHRRAFDLALALWPADHQHHRHEIQHPREHLDLSRERLNAEHAGGERRDHAAGPDEPGEIEHLRLADGDPAAFVARCGTRSSPGRPRSRRARAR